MSHTVESGLTSVIVVTANSGPLAIECIDKLRASTARFELIVIDNASSDGAIERIESRFRDDAHVRILRNVQNVGFGPACNQATRIARGDCLLILNPDCLVEADTLAKLRAIARSHPQAGILGVRVVSPDRRGERASRRRDPSLWRALCTLTGLARLERRWPALGGMEMLPADAPIDVESVDAVSGACLFIRRDAFDAISGFDEGYFLHCEDLDLCRRIREAGFEVACIGSITLRHEQGSSSHGRPLFVSRHKHRGMWRYFCKFDEAARNPLLRALVWCGIWAHFAVLAPLNAWKQSKQSRRSTH